MSDWVTEIEIRQKGDRSHEVAYETVLDLATRLVAEGWNVILRPTLPDIPVGSKSPDWDDEDSSEDE